MWNRKRLSAMLKVIAASMALVFAADAFRDKADKESVALEDGYYLYDFAMGTSISCQVYGDIAAAKEAAYNIDKEIKRLDNSVISWRNPESELAGINAAYVSGQDISLSDELALILGETYELCEASKGALDITIRPLLKLWGIEDAGGDFLVPKDSSIKQILGTLGYDRLHINGNKLSIDGEDIILDLGAVGKGYALDCVRNLLIPGDTFSDSPDDLENALKEYGLDGAIISIGGSILVLGSKGDASPWKVGIRNPKGNIDDILGYVVVSPNENICISTSGDYEKFVEKDGVKYHHIIDMSTGYPADTGLSSVTVICGEGLISDGLSTACFVLGYEKSKGLLDRYNAKAIFIDRENNVTVYGDINFVTN